jgi:large subunit ribosomal protein L22
MADEKNDKKDAKAKAAEKSADKAAAKKETAKAGSSSGKESSKAAAKKDAPKAEAKKDAKGEKPESGKKAKKETAKKEPKAKKGAKGKKGESKEDKKAAKKAPGKGAKAKAPAAPPVVRARARYVRVAPRKARLVADQVRGLHIEQALALLQFSPRGASRDIQKLIESAAANAENNHDLIGDEMRISSITVDEGPTLRRFRPRALGRATPINKRTSHIAVALTPAEDD